MAPSQAGGLKSPALAPHVPVFYRWVAGHRTPGGHHLAVSLGQDFRHSLAASSAQDLTGLQSRWARLHSFITPVPSQPVSLHLQGRQESL